MLRADGGHARRRQAGQGDAEAAKPKEVIHVVKRKHTRMLVAGLALTALVVLGGYLLLSGGKSYSKDLGGLRSQFNRDRGKVRLLMVLSPT